MGLLHDEHHCKKRVLIPNISTEIFSEKNKLDITTSTQMTAQPHITHGSLIDFSDTETLQINKNNIQRQAFDTIGKYLL